jgi:hypothetical protein
LGKRKRLSTIHNRSLFAAKQKVFPSHTGNGKTSRKRFSARAYGVGEEAGEEVVLIVVLDSVFVDVVGEGFTTVVLLSVFLSPGGLTVSVFCSQAASKDAAPAKMQMYFFISCDAHTGSHKYSMQGGISALPGCNYVGAEKLQFAVKTRAQRVARGLRQRPEW